MRILLLLAAFAMASTAAQAQSPFRAIAAKANKEWKHKQSGVHIPAALGPYTRVSIQDTGSEELDIIVQLERGDGGSIATLYLFRPAISSVPLWFDRARTVIELRNNFQVSSGEQPVATFAPPGTTVTSAMRATYPIDYNNHRSTSVAIVPVGDWLAKIRVTSQWSATATEAEVAAIVAAIGWPKTTVEAPRALPMEPCAQPMAWSQATPLDPKEDQTRALVLAAAVINMAELEKLTQEKAPPAQYCREGAGTMVTAVYRNREQTDGYVIALQDAGRAIEVSRTALEADQDKFIVTFRGLGLREIFPGFKNLPTPEQAMEMINTTSPMSRVRGDKTIEMMFE